MSKEIQNLELTKNQFYQKIENFEDEKKILQKKNAILLVLPIQEISLWQELSSPPHFRF